MKPPQGPSYVLEGNPDEPAPLSREQLDAWITQPSYQGYQVFPRRAVKIKQRQDNIEFAARVEAVDESLGRVLAKLKTLLSEDARAAYACALVYQLNINLSAAERQQYADKAKTILNG